MRRSQVHEEHQRIKTPKKDENTSKWKMETKRLQLQNNQEQGVSQGKVCGVCLVMSDCLQPRGLQPSRLLCPWDFSRQEYWSGFPFPTPGDIPDPWIKLTFLTSPVLVGGFFITAPTGNPLQGKRNQYFLILIKSHLQGSTKGILS